MGGFCSRRSSVDNAPSGSLTNVDGSSSNDSNVHQSGGMHKKGNDISIPSSGGENGDEELREPLSSSVENEGSRSLSLEDLSDGIPRLSRALSQKSSSTRSKQVTVAKVSEVGTLLGKAGGKAVEVLDTLGSSMTNLNLSSGFTSGVTTKGIKIAILAFEVANTIVKGANLMQSLSKDSIKHLKEVVLPSEGVQNLISKDIDELLRIAASDKREELKVFSREVVRFGNRCKDPQWHNLDRYFEKLDSEFTSEKLMKDEAERTMQQLMELVQYTAELYHELHALDRFEQDYQRKLQEEDNPNATHKGDSLTMLRAELKSQRKHVRSLKKKSLWSRILEEVMEKLVDIVHFLHSEIHEAFGTADSDKYLTGSASSSKTLGSAGLALHYANIIGQIDTLVSRSGSVPPNSREALYQGLPAHVKTALRSKLLSFQLVEELSIPQIKGEMEKTLQWLAPLAANTTKAHHGFGWVGEWANTGSDLNRKPTGQNDLLRIETLHHADKEKTDVYILELVVWLHYLVSQARASNGGFRSPIRSPNQSTVQLPMNSKPKSPSSALTMEDQEMLRDVNKRKLLTPGISKSQEFEIAKVRLCKHHRLSKSSSHSPTRESNKDPFPLRRPSSVPIIDFDIDRIKALDVIDRVDTIRGG
ncbi:protein PSK SIMULATOR 1 [Rhodamnia argentea]|uniref:Protein PSK SIMULATOR 1 n=1 Tax=Rhodamnia argentea TaxID=178133 RepID=A0A8B8QFF6_9MYRT|nr:protein PSK SIMULATOR 1 [Rhodamnia argentea]